MATTPNRKGKHCIKLEGQNVRSHTRSGYKVSGYYRPAYTVCQVRTKKDGSVKRVKNSRCPCAR